MNEQNINNVSMDKERDDTSTGLQNSKRYWLPVRAILLLVVVVGALYAFTQTNRDSVMRIGYIGPLTGDAAILGIEASNAITLAVEEINARGGVNGKQVELFVEDDQYNTAQSVTAYEKLVNQRGVETLMMSTYGGFFAVANNAKRDNVLLINVLDCDQDIANLNADNSNIFCIAKETKDLADVIADHAVASNYEQIGIIHSTVDKFMPSVALMFQERVGTNANVQIESYTAGTSDFRTPLLKFQNKDAIVFLGYGEIGLAIRQARDIGLNKPMLSIPSVATDPSIQEASGGAIDGMYFSFYAPEEGNPNMKEFYSAYEERFGRGPIVYVATDQAYDAISILLKEVLPSSSNINSKIRAMKDVQDYQGVSGNLTMGGDGRIQGIKIKLYQLRDLIPVYVGE